MRTIPLQWYKIVDINLRCKQHSGLRGFPMGISLALIWSYMQHVVLDTRIISHGSGAYSTNSHYTSMRRFRAS